MRKCKQCGKSCEGDFCFSHKPRKKLKSSYKFISTNPTRDIDKTYEMRVFFMKIWNKRPHKSQISYIYLGKEPSSGYFHHILEKSKYPELALIEENIILLTLDEHATVESDMYAYSLINIKRENLKDKYLKLK